MARKTTKPSANHLRAWREFRGMTQGELAEKLGTKGNVIGNLESGERGLSDKWLMRLAPVLGTRPGFLLDFAPEDLEGDFLEVALSVADEDREQAKVILQTFRKKAG